MSTQTKKTRAYPYDSSPIDLYLLSKDGLPIMRDTENNCWSYLHAITTVSVSESLLRGGYTMEPLKEETDGN